MTRQGSGCLLSLIGRLVSFEGLSTSGIMLGGAGRGFVHLVRGVLVPFRMFTRRQGVGVVACFQLYAPF